MRRSARRLLPPGVCSWQPRFWREVRGKCCAAAALLSSTFSHAEPGACNQSNQPRTLRNPVACAGMSDASIARPLCALLRQLVSRDGNKELFVEGGGLELLAVLLGAQRSSPAVLEQALGLLTNVTLRYPEAAARVRLSGAGVRYGWAAGLALLCSFLCIQLPPVITVRMPSPPTPCRPQRAAAWMQRWS